MKLNTWKSSVGISVAVTVVAVIYSIITGLSWLFFSFLAFLILNPWIDTYVERYWWFMPLFFFLVFVQAVIIGLLLELVRAGIRLIRK